MGLRCLCEILIVERISAPFPPVSMRRNSTMHNEEGGPRDPISSLTTVLIRLIAHYYGW